MAGTILRVDGRARWAVIAGAGPVVVLEPAIADVGLTWWKVQPEAAAFATVFTHDRPGLGRSEPISTPRVAASMVDDLRSALAAASLTPPFVLVGHSFASLTIRAFACLHPDEVSGLLLVDGAHEDQMERFPAELDPGPMLAGFSASLRRLAESASRGEKVEPLAPIPTGVPKDLVDDYLEATAPTPVHLEAAAAEYEGLAVSQDQVRSLMSSHPRDVPLIALRHGISQPVPGVSEAVNRRYEEAWVQLQEELAARSESGEVRLAPDAGHLIHHDRPDLVVSAIRDLVFRS